MLDHFSTNSKKSTYSIKRRCFNFFTFDVFYFCFIIFPERLNSFLCFISPGSVRGVLNSSTPMATPVWSRLSCEHTNLASSTNVGVAGWCKAGKNAPEHARWCLWKLHKEHHRSLPSILLCYQYPFGRLLGFLFRHWYLAKPGRVPTKTRTVILVDVDSRLSCETGWFESFLAL